MNSVFDQDETVDMMGPMIIHESSKHRAGLDDLVFDLVKETTALNSSLPQSILATLADLVRSMNCYYSNLIEGHDTHPVDIERALNDDFSDDPHKRDLQYEAKAHISVQKWIDSGEMKGKATSSENIREIHRRFCELLPTDMLSADNPNTGKKHPLVPGELRKDYVQVGRHVAVSPGSVPRFMTRFESAYANLGKVDAVLAAASAHHRLVWIHPFIDGNGRVARLMSHAMLLDALGTDAVWSVSRGLAREQKKYIQHLIACDLKRRNDYDGRGPLSEEELARFTRFFLETCIDQVCFMRDLVDPKNLHARILVWAEEEMQKNDLPPKSGVVLASAIAKGELLRSEVPKILGTTDRHARRITSALQQAGALTSDNNRAPLRLAFPANLAHRWLPGLFPSWQ